MSTPNDFDRRLPAINPDQSSGAVSWQRQQSPIAMAPTALKVSTNGQMPEAGFDVKTLLKAFRRQWMPALAVGLVLMVIAAGVAWVVVPRSKYGARATLLVNTARSKIIFETAEPSLDFPTYQKTQVALITSRMVLNAVLRDPKVAQLPTVRDQLDALEWLEKDLKVEFPGGSTVLQISLNGDNPTDLAAVVNVVIDRYMDMIVDEEGRIRRKRLEDLQKVYDTEAARLKEERNALRNLSLNIGTADTPTAMLKQQFDMQTLSLAQQERVGLHSRIRLAEIKVNMIEASRNSMGGGNSQIAFAANPPIDSDPVLQTLVTRRDEAQRKIADFERKYRKTFDVAIQKTRGELATLKKAISDRRNDLLTRGPTPVAEGPQAVEGKSELDAARDELRLLVQWDKALEQDIDEKKNDVKMQNLTTQDMQTESERIAMIAATATGVGAEVEKLKLELTAPPRVRLLNKADVPKQKDEAKRMKMVGAAALGAFACGLLGVSLWEYRTRRVYSTHEVVQSLGLNLVGTLPALPVSSGRALSRRGQAELDRWHSLMVESIDATRTMLMHVARVEGLRAVMITSALKGEGKTSLSSHLATSLARAGLKTLLVDSDLRNPSAHRLYDLPPEPGLCELLRGEITLEEAIVEVVGPSPLGTLSVLPAGRCDPQALSALAQDGMRNVLAILKTQYDFVIVDSAPVLPVADTLLLGQQVDAVLFSILRDVSRINHVHAAYDRLSRLGVRMLGAVINGDSPSSYGSRYSYGYGYGSSNKAK